MLLNVSYNDPDTKGRMEAEVGMPFGLRERIRLGGIGSPKLTISSCSLDIHNLLVLDNNINTCNIELRPKGVILRFRSLLETYALIVPFYKLSLYKGRSDEYSLHRDDQFVKVFARDKSIHSFFKKLIRLKNDNAPTAIDDL